MNRTLTIRVTIMFRSRLLKGPIPSQRKRLLIGCAVTALAAGAAAAEGPSGGAVALGTATISAGDARTTIRQSSERAIIDWQGFNVGSDHTVTFDQPGRNSATLNRVATPGRSVIEGAIEAPGTVIIQNNAGVIFTRDARIDAGSLVATTQSVDGEIFQRDGRLVIGGGEAADARIVNDGRITVGESGLAALVGGDVENAGAIVAREGSVLLASGRKTTIDLSGDGTLRFAVDGDAGTAVRGVRNSGTIDATDGRVVISAGAAARTLDAAINTTGAIRANGIAGDGGRIEIIGRGTGAVRIAGPVEAKGSARGGDIAATGATVEIAPTARISASGSTDGGRVRLGGDWQGQGDLGRAEHLTMAEGTRIAADGGSGRGGEVVLWADGTTQVDGAISATGAAGGGRVETSGAFALGIGESADVRLGTGGLWLLDPRDVVIATGGLNPVLPGTTTPPPGTTPYTISRNGIQSVLNSGSDVTISTAQPASTMAGDITVSSAVSWSGAGNLTLLADGSIFVNANVEATGTGGLRFSAAGDVSIGGGGGNRTVRTTSGALEISAGGTVLFRRLNPASNNVQVYSGTGPVDVTAGTAIRVEGGAANGRWVRIGRLGNGSAITFDAPEIVLQGGGAADSFAEVVTGAGGSIAMTADRISVLDGAGSPGRMIASGQAPLTLRAETQTWNGRVQAGDGTAGNLGGNVTIAGDITASVAPVFALAPGRSFAMEPAGPGGTASRYTSPQPLTVTTSGAGTIEVGGPVAVSRLLLSSEERVGLGAAATLAASGTGDALVVAAGRQFRNDAGAGALSVADPGARWLVYVDTFAGLSGTAPGSRGFDLYGRPYAANLPPSLAAFAGNRIVYGETPVLTVTGETLSKTYGVAVTPGFVLSGLRPGDAASAFATGPTVTSAGAAAGADAGAYATTVSATASAQGYALVLADGTLTVVPAPLTVTAEDASRAVGAPNPPFTARIEGFVLGQTDAVLGGTLAFATPATAASPPGTYAITPSGLASTNYAISFVDGTLSVLGPLEPPLPPVTPPAAGTTLPSVLSSLDIVGPGAPPFTPGDAAFRTTLAEAPTARDSTFVLTYSLGEIVQLASPEVAGTGGFVPAAAGASATGPCGGPIALGDGTGCVTVAVTESFWGTAFQGAGN